MRKRIKVNELPEFDAVPYLNNEKAIAAYLTDILEANDAALLAAALGDIARAGWPKSPRRPGSPAKHCTKHYGRTARRASTRLTVSAPRSACGWWRSRSMPKWRDTQY